MKTVAADLSLTPDEVSLVLLYRECTDYAQAVQLQMAQAYADVYPRHIAPTLHLVGESQTASLSSAGRPRKRKPAMLRLVSGR